MEPLAFFLAAAVGIALLWWRTVANENQAEEWHDRKAADARAHQYVPGVCTVWDDEHGMGVIVGDGEFGSVSVDRASLDGNHLSVGDRVYFDWTEPIAGANGLRRKAMRVRPRRP